MLSNTTSFKDNGDLYSHNSHSIIFKYSNNIKQQTLICVNVEFKNCEINKINPIEFQLEQNQ